MAEFNAGSVVFVPMPTAPEMVLWPTPGPQGEVGPIGPKGDKGDQGDQGIQGPKGDKGDTGDTGTTTWEGITNKPTTFPPESHGHSVTQVTGLQSALDGKADLVSGKVPESQLPDLGGSTDASLLTGALTSQVDATDATATTSYGSATIGSWLESVYDGLAYIPAAIDGKADVGHTHPVSDVDATGTASSSTYLRGDGSWATPPSTAADVGAVANEGGADGLWIGTEATLPPTGTAGVLYVTY